MPVLITGANGLVGRALAHRLLTEGGQVRVYLRRDDAELRAAGAHIALGPADSVERLEAALTQVHTIVALVGGAWPERGVSYDWLNRDTVESAVIAARASDVKRFIFLSVPGADPDARNELLAAKGRAERHIIEGGMEYAILRCAPIAEGIAATFERLRNGAILTVPGSGAQRFTPVSLVDAVDAIVAADAREAEVRGTWDLGGPVEVTMDELVARYAPGVTRVVHSSALSNAPRAFTDLYAAGITVDASAAVTQFGLSLT